MDTSGFLSNKHPTILTICVEYNSSPITHVQLAELGDINFESRARNMSSISVECIHVITGGCESILYYSASYAIDVIHTVKSPYSKNSLSPLSPKNEKQQFSPNIINASSNKIVMRIDEMITKAKVLMFSLL